MIKDRQKLYQLYHTMLCMVLTCAVTLAINHYYELKVPVFLAIVLSLIPAVSVYLFDTNRKNTFTYLIILCILMILAFIFWLKKINPITWVNDLIQWGNTYDGTEQTYNASNAKFIVFVVAFAGTIIFYLLMKRQAAKIILALVLIAAMFILSINQVDIDKIVVCISLFYIMTILVEISGILYSRKAGRQDKRAGILYLAPICLLLAILAISLPSKPEPIQWKGIKLLYSNVKEQFDAWWVDIEYYFSRSDGEFAINYTGYDDDSGKLGNGGDLNKDNSIALKVSGYKGNNPVYLIGTVSDIYTGYSWEKSNKEIIEGEQEYFLDYAELVNALARQDKKVLEEEQFIERRYLTIDYNRIRTKTCFYPLKSSWLDTESEKNIPLTEYGNIKFPHTAGKNTLYNIVSYSMNLQGEAFQQMLRDADSFSYDKVQETNEDTVQWLAENLLYEDNVTSDQIWKSYASLKQRAKIIHERYTNLPDSLPARVKDLTNEITAGYDNTFDKLKAIEAYLNTYPYTLSPGEIPEGRDFVDYFLFENRKGYCTSFASAMAIMARCIGVPARYVEGFVVTYKTDESDNMFPVKNSQAHAWAETYIDGVGWIPFEPTSPFYDYRYTTWAEKTVVQENPYTEIPDYYDYYQRMHDNSNLPTVNNSPTPVEVKEKVNVLNSIIIFIVTILIILMIFIIYYYVLKFRYKKAFDKADYSKKMYMLFLRILRLLEQEGFVLEQQETIRMLAQRVKDKIHYGKITFRNVAEIFMHYRYAQAEVTKEEYEQVNDFHRELVSIQREERNRFYLLLDEFVFLAKKSNR